jgi:hypothetical protein
MTFVNDTNEKLTLMFFLPEASVGVIYVDAGASYTRDFSEYGAGDVQVGVLNETFSVQADDSQTVEISLTGEG